MMQSDSTIGKTFFADRLQQRGVQIYGANRKPRQTPRPAGVNLSDVIFPWIDGSRPEVMATLAAFRATHVDASGKGTFSHCVDLDGFQIHMGLGGIHGCIDREHVTGGYILDLDVTSYYPSLAIQHRIFPEHLGETFCDVYQELFTERQTHAKGSSENAALKLALNSVFGDSNNKYGPFYDPAYMCGITVNGQLLLLKLAEALSLISGVRLIQINTDGVTIQYTTRHQAQRVAAVADWWQTYSKLTLEAVQYSDMWIRDVNNYSARDMSGKMKHKGAYDYKRDWWQNHSALVVPRVVETHHLTGQPIADLVRNHPDPFDFMIRAKAPRGSRLELGDGTLCPATTRYYISTNGERLTKIMPPLKGKTEPRTIGIHCEGQAVIHGGRNAYVCGACGALFPTKAGATEHNDREHCWKVTTCNTFDGTMPVDIDYGWYINEAAKLVITTAPLAP